MNRFKQTSETSKFYLRKTIGSSENDQKNNEKPICKCSAKTFINLNVINYTISFS